MHVLFVGSVVEEGLGDEVVEVVVLGDVGIFLTPEIVIDERDVGLDGVEEGCEDTRVTLGGVDYIVYAIVLVFAGVMEFGDMVAREFGIEVIEIGWNGRARYGGFDGGLRYPEDIV